MNQDNMGFLNFKQEAFGLDISDLSLKIINLKKERGNNLGLACFGEAEIKPGIMEEGEIKDEGSLTKIVKEAVGNVKGEKLRTKYVVCSLPEEKAFLQVIQMPKMEKEDLEKAIVFEAENYIPLPVKETYLDYQAVEPLKDGLSHADVLIASFPQKIINSYVNVLKTAGLIPCVLEIESQAISRALIKNETAYCTLFFVDFGETRASFAVFAGRSLRFTSTIPVSSRKITEAIAQNMKIDPVEAEKIKENFNLLKKDKSGGEEIFKALSPVLTDLAEQIKNRIGYYKNHASHEHLPLDGSVGEKILLCGGGSSLKGLTNFLSLQIGLPVELGNPWINILPEPIKEIPRLPYEKSLRYATALGLALRGFRENNL